MFRMAAKEMLYEAPTNVYKSDHVEIKRNGSEHRHSFSRTQLTFHTYCACFEARIRVRKTYGGEERVGSERQTQEDVKSGSDR